MVSFHTPDLSSPSPPRTRTRPVPQELEGNSKKRKLCYKSEYEEFYDKSVRVHQNMMNYLTNTDHHHHHHHHHLHLETPLPSEWQQCLDIKSGKLYFYNTRTQKKTSSDPRSSPELSTTTTDHHMSLELALNLPCDNSMSNKNHHQVTENLTKFLNHHDHQLTNSAKIISNNIDTVTTGLGLSRSPSWLTIEREGEEEEEMITAVCNKCHMLVMMSKSSPSCPNCKFMHSPDNTTPTLFKRSLTTLLC